MRAKLHFVLSITILFGGFSGLAQQVYWKQIQERTVSEKASDSNKPIFFELQPTSFGKVLEKVGQEIPVEVYFPDNKGNMILFEVRETSVFHPELSKKYPEIRSFSGLSLDRTRKIRFSHSHKGLAYMLLDYVTGQSTFLQREKGNKDTYRMYSRNTTDVKTQFVCSTPFMQKLKGFGTAKNLVDEQILRTFRIAVSTTGEYTDYHGGGVADALAAINTTLTRVNEVFETDLGVTLQLIPNNDLVIFTDAATDPYSGSLNAQVQNTLTTTIGEENYDVGHLFHRDNDNGNAGFIGSVCSDNRKGSAFASALVPEGDLFDLDYVAHELGHQFGANHTWSFESEGTDVQAEPASGTTIMGYAGIVDGNNVAPNGDDYFHHNSIAQIQEFLATTSCSLNTALTNNPPTIVPQTDYVIPAGTPFVLLGNASDIDGDLLTYTWEQIDDGVVVASTFGPNNTAGANFRSLRPSTNPMRYFPNLLQVLSGDLEQTNPVTNDSWETVSNVERQLNFAFTVRDNNSEGGQVTADTVTIDVVSSAGPFSVTSQSTNETYEGGSVQDITWNVANTNLPPINAETVDIYLSLNGGLDFTEVLAEDVPNSGFAQVQLPGSATTNGRIMIRARNNVFFAVNEAEFTITEVQAILNFEQLSFDTCSPNDIIIPLVYETYNGFSESMDLSVVSSEAFSTNFSQGSVVANNTAVDLTLGNVANISTGSYQIEVVATGQTFTTSTVLEINVFDGTFEDVSLTFPQNLAIGTAIVPDFNWQENNNHTAFDIEIATDETFTNIVESASVSFNAYKSTGLQPETTYYWRVRPKNQCGEGAFGTPFSFTTSVVNCASFDTNDQPQEIPIEGTPTITASIFLPQDLKVSDINVNLEVSHTYLEDLVVSLISPAGTRVVLISKNCGNQNNLIATFDDEGQPISCSGNPAISGVIQPLGFLSSFNGESTLGEWVLEIEDTASSDGGSLDAFSLEICVEGIFRPDDDEDGVFDDGDDLCLGTPKGSLVDTSGCPLNAFPTNNFSVSIQSESCGDNNDGSISVSAQDDMIDYSATLTGNGVNSSFSFNETTLFTNLAAGTYQLCIDGSDEATVFRETCFEVILNEPEPLSVLANLLADGDQVALTMSGGQLYNIELNGLVKQTLEDSFVVNLQEGLNTLKVSTGLLCQGVFERQYFVSSEGRIYPNPGINWVTLSYPFENKNTSIKIFSPEGRFIKEWSGRFGGYTADLNISELSIGLYYVVIENGGVTATCKLVKR